jgi:NTP pyrophosphatase (non-canonical NTP hydrolase)
MDESNSYRSRQVDRIAQADTHEIRTLLDFELTTDLGATYPDVPRPDIDPPVDGPGDVRRILYPTLGLAGEAGEVANRVKKVIRDADGQISAAARYDLLDELGDVLWYLARVAVELDSSLTEVAQLNVRKLRERRARAVLAEAGRGT